MNERKTQQAKLRQQVAPFPFFLACLFTSFVRGGIHKPSGTWNPLQALFTHDKPGRTIFGIRPANPVYHSLSEFGMLLP